MVRKKKEETDKMEFGIYKVCLPSFLAYPTWETILKICYTKEETEKYIETYPNPFFKSFLSVKYEKLTYNPTD